MDGQCLRDNLEADRPNCGAEDAKPALSPSQRALVVSSVYSAGEMSQRLGREAYSYRFVFDAFAPLLSRWGRTVEVTQAESRLDYALWRARQQELEPIHLSFLPLHMTYLSRRAANVAFPFWEFPDIPNRAFDNNLRNNWVHVAERLDLILTACAFTRDAFLRAGVKTPVRVVPVPIQPEYFSVPAWQPGQETVLECPCYVFPQPAGPAGPEANPWVPARISGLSPKARARFIYKSYIAPRIPARLEKYMRVVARSASALVGARSEDVRIPFPVHDRVNLSGVVYTTILNPFDPRKNWEDLLSAFLLALGDREDATLVVKLVVPPRLLPPVLNGILYHYHKLGITHRCKLVFMTGYLADRQMIDLAQASTYYVNCARAEGSCLPLQNFLAAGRPGIAPAHTAMADYFSDDMGFVIDAHPEPACWPHDPQKQISTRWYRVVWQSLFNHFRTSYQIAAEDRERYRSLAACGTEQIAGFAGADQVWPRLAAALDCVAGTGKGGAQQMLPRLHFQRRRAS